MGRGDAYTGFWWENLRERDHLEDTEVDGRIILRWIFRTWEGEAWTGSGSRYTQVAGYCECGNELSGFISCGDFLD
jgi:hypothetical protein